jgi:cytochrome P450
MRKDHDEHRTERMAMMPALMPKTIDSVWAPLYAKLAAAYLDRLPRGEVVDLFSALAGPLAARILAHAIGVRDASDEDMQRWSQTLIDGAGNFGWTPGPFEGPTSPMRRWISVSAPTPMTPARKIESIDRGDDGPRSMPE